MLKNLFGFAHNLWLNFQLKSPPFIRQKLIPHLHDLKEIARLVTRIYLPVTRWQGHGQEGLLTVTYIGFGYAKPFLKGAIFTEEPNEELVTRIPFWRCSQAIKTITTDLVIVENSKHFIHRLPSQNAIIFPQHVEHVIDVRGDWLDVQSRFRKNFRKELKQVHKYDYECDLSREIKDFEEFYDYMYAPTTQERHSNRSMPISAREAYQYFRHGALFRVKRNGEWIAGGIFHPEGKTLILDMGGVKEGNMEFIREGVNNARLYATVQWANQNGYEDVNLLGSGPRLKGGLFQFKRKWGGSVTISPYLHRLIWLSVRRNTPAVRKFLKDTPIITVDKARRLGILVTVDNPEELSADTVQYWEKQYVTPGVSNFLIRSVDSFVEDLPKSNQSNIIIPILPNGNLENTSLTFMRQ